MGDARRIARRIVAESYGARREREIHELDQQFERPPVLPANRSVYQQLLASGVELDSHESDLYAEVTPESTRIIEESGHSSSVFRSDVDGQMWYDLPFAYDPFWRDKQRAMGGQMNTGRIERRIIADADDGKPRCKACGETNCTGAAFGPGHCDERPMKELPAAPGDMNQPLPPGHLPIPNPLR